MDHIILHADINSCYASIEHALHPEYTGLPLAVAGSMEDRHGIILAKDELAKQCGVKTGMAIWQARLLCPELNLLPPRMDIYLKFSAEVQKIYSEYTNFREPFGIDESWLDLTGCYAVKDGMTAAQEIGRRVKKELNITVSAGVSWNKIFAKLGSDYKKPDAVTGIFRSNYRQIVWPLPVEDLLYVGRATAVKLRRVGICTIGELAGSDPELLRSMLGKMGYVLHAFANGRDTSPVRQDDFAVPVKSIGNSTTAPRDLVCDEDVRITLLALTESVAMCLRESGLRSRLVSLAVRTADLRWRSHQYRLSCATDSTKELFLAGMALFRELHCWPAPIRSIGISVGALESAAVPVQTDLFGEDAARQHQAALDSAIDRIRKKYGFDGIRRGLTASDLSLGGLCAKEAHAVHPVGFFGGH